MSEMHIYGNLRNNDAEQVYQNTNFAEDQWTGRKKPSYLVALDVGTSYCGYSFAQADTPKEITLNKNWASQYSYVSLKAPTAVFGSADKRRKSIGFKANEDFEEDFDTTDKPGMLLNFKNKTTKKAVDKKSRKRSLKCTEILLKQLKDHAINAINTKYDKRISSDDISWFIPVPSIWTSKDCDKVGRKAVKAGLVHDPRNLTKVKESHAAFTHCISQRRHSEKSPKQAIVISAGGWDIEVSLFSLIPDRAKQLKYQLMFDNNVGFGGNYINDLFFNYIKEEKNLGAKFIAKCKERNPAAWLDLRKQFEQVKQGSAPDSKLQFTMQLLPSFGDLFHEVRHESLGSFLKDNKDLHLSRDGKLVLSNRKMQYFYKWAMGKFRQEMIRIMGDHQVNTIDKVFLAGGFGASSHLQVEVRKFFPRKQVIIPENGNMCAVNGCIMTEAGVVSIL